MVSHLDGKMRKVAPHAALPLPIFSLPKREGRKSSAKRCFVPSSYPVTFMRVEHNAERFYPLNVEREGEKSIENKQNVFSLLIKTGFNKYFQS